MPAAAPAKLPHLDIDEPVQKAENIVFPADARVVDVTQPPYNARGDGVTDDTEAIQKALNDHPNQGVIIYVPNGHYRVSATLRWPHGQQGGGEEKNTTLQGQSECGSILLLPDKHPDFQNRDHASPVIWTGQVSSQRFGNEIRNLTVCTGRGNPGASGIQFMAHNQGCLRHVTIVSGDGQGVIGLDLGYADGNGPLFIKNTTIIGFDHGIRTATQVNSETMEHVVLANQRVAGIHNDGQCLTIRGLLSTNDVPAIINEDAGFLTLIEARLHGTGCASNTPAVINRAALLARDVLVNGYSHAVMCPGEPARDVPVGMVKEYASHPVLSLYPSQSSTLRLPVQETPDVAWDDLGQWLSPTHYGARPDDDRSDSDAIQTAIDAGSTTVYFPRGTYRIDKTVVIRKNVHRIIGCKACFSVGDALRNDGGSLFRFEDGAAPVVIMERLSTDYSGGGQVFVEHAANRTLVLSSVAVNFQGAQAYHNTGHGDCFIEDFVGGRLQFHGQRVWARQFNVENLGNHVENQAGSLWVLGFKAERGGTLIDTLRGGKTEVLGGLCHTTTSGKLAPMFVIDESTASLSIGESCFNGEPFQVLAREIRGTEMRELKQGQAPTRTGGSLLVLYSAQFTKAANVPVPQPEIASNTNVPAVKK